MSQTKAAKAIAAELDKVGPDGPDDKLTARLIGNALISLARIADALDRASPPTVVLEAE